MLKSLPKIITIFFLAIFIFQLACLLFLTLAPNIGQAATSAPFKPQVGIGSDFQAGTSYTPDGSTAMIAKYIRAIYKYAIGIVGILAAVVLMIGGVMWIVAGGNSTAIGEAKSWIGASLTGLVLALMSYLILATINPALVDLKTTTIKKIEEIKTQSTLKENDSCILNQAPYCADGLDCTNGKCTPNANALNICNKPTTRWIKTNDCSSIGVNLADWNCTVCKGSKADDTYKCCGGVSTSTTVLQGGCCLGPKGSFQYTQCFDGQSLTQNDCYFMANNGSAPGDYIPNKRCTDIIVSGNARKACQ